MAEGLPEVPATVARAPSAPRQHLASMSYSERLDFLRDDPSNYTVGSPHCTITLARYRGVIDEPIARGLIESAEKQVDFVDFKLMVLVRLLHFEYPQEQPLFRDAIRVMLSFPFWPVGSKHKCLQSFGFWSENHAFMFLSSAHLMCQKLYGADEATEEKHRETKLLLGFLRAHVHPLFNGVYECLSQVYLPYTLSAMLNLIDFSQNDEVRTLATQVAHNIVELLALGTTDQGVVSLTPSCRTFLRCRTRTWGHNVNQLMLILTGLSVEPYRAQAITGFILTSSYRPREDALKTLIYGESLWQRMPISHNVTETDIVYADLEEDEKVPFLWGAGLVTHPDYIERTRRFQHKFGLSQHPHLMPLSFLPRRWSHFLMDSMSHWSKGQNYTSVNLTVYKAPGGLMLSSIQKYNVSLCGFQQMPWMANVSGVGVWSQSGSSTSKFAYFDITNIFSPCVEQLGKMLVAAYSVPKYLSSMGVTSFLEKSSFLHWPSQLFDEEVRQCRIGNNGEIYWRTIPRANDVDRADTTSPADESGNEDEIEFLQSRESQQHSEIESDAEDDINDGKSMEETARDTIRSEIGDPTHQSASKSDDSSKALGPGVDDNSMAQEPLAAGNPQKIKKKKGFSFSRLTKSISRRVTNMLSSADDDSINNENGLFAGAWWIGRRGSCLIGATCTDVTSISHSSRPNDAVKLHPNSKGVVCPRRVCETKNHAWVIRVGSLKPHPTRKRCASDGGSADFSDPVARHHDAGEQTHVEGSNFSSSDPAPGIPEAVGSSECFDSIDAFAHYCCSIALGHETRVDHTSGHVEYVVRVLDPHQGQMLETSIDTESE